MPRTFPRWGVRGCQMTGALLWALYVLIFERKGNRNTQRKILIAQERSTITDTQLAHKRTKPDLVSVVRGTMHYRGGQLRGADFSRGMHWCATVVSYDLVISHTKL